MGCKKRRKLTLRSWADDIITPTLSCILSHCCWTVFIVITARYFPRRWKPRNVTAKWHRPHLICARPARAGHASGQVPARPRMGAVLTGHLPRSLQARTKARIAPVAPCADQKQCAAETLPTGHMSHAKNCDFLTFCRVSRNSGRRSTRSVLFENSLESRIVCRVSERAL